MNKNVGNSANSSFFTPWMEQGEPYKPRVAIQERDYDSMSVHIGAQDNMALEVPPLPLPQGPAHSHDEALRTLVQRLRSTIGFAGSAIPLRNTSYRIKQLQRTLPVGTAADAVYRPATLPVVVAMDSMIRYDTALQAGASEEEQISTIFTQDALPHMPTQLGRPPTPLDNERVHAMADAYLSQQVLQILSQAQRSDEHARVDKAYRTYGQLLEHRDELQRIRANEGLPLITATRISTLALDDTTGSLLQQLKQLATEQHVAAEKTEKGWQRGAAATELPEHVEKVLHMLQARIAVGMDSAENTINEALLQLLRLNVHAKLKQHIPQLKQLHDQQVARHIITLLSGPACLQAMPRPLLVADAPRRAAALLLRTSHLVWMVRDGSGHFPLAGYLWNSAAAEQSQQERFAPHLSNLHIGPIGQLPKAIATDINGVRNMPGVPRPFGVEPLPSAKLEAIEEALPSISARVEHLLNPQKQR